MSSTFLASHLFRCSRGLEARRCEPNESREFEPEPRVKASYRFAGVGSLAM